MKMSRGRNLITATAVAMLVALAGPALAARADAGPTPITIEDPCSAFPSCPTATTTAAPAPPKLPSECPPPWDAASSLKCSANYDLPDGGYVHLPNSDEGAYLVDGLAFGGGGIQIPARDFSLTSYTRYPSARVISALPAGVGYTVSPTPRFGVASWHDGVGWDYQPGRVPGRDVFQFRLCAARVLSGVSLLQCFVETMDITVLGPTGDKPPSAPTTPPQSDTVVPSMTPVGFMKPVAKPVAMPVTNPVAKPVATPVTKPAANPVAPSMAGATKRPLPTAAEAGEASTSGQLAAGGSAAFAAFIALGGAYALRRRRDEA